MPAGEGQKACQLCVAACPMLCFPREGARLYFSVDIFPFRCDLSSRPRHFSPSVGGDYLSLLIFLVSFDIILR